MPFNAFALTCTRAGADGLAGVTGFVSSAFFAGAVTIDKSYSISSALKLDVSYFVPFVLHVWMSMYIALAKSIVSLPMAIPSFVA